VRLGSTRISVVLAVALPLFGLQLGLLMDDYTLVLRARGQLDAFGSPWDLFRFTGASSADFHRLIELGYWPWWSWPELKLAFFRPLSSALIHFDVGVLGDHPLLWHLHSIAWYLAVCALVFALYRRIVPAAAAGLALLFFVVDDTHTMTVAWLANRNSLVAAVPALAGLLLHLKWREDGWRPGAPLSALAYAAALAGGESALGVLVFVVAYEALYAADQPWRRRALACLPLVGVLVPWALLYRALDRGAFGSAMYLDPSSEPSVYLAAASARFFALLGTLTLGANSDSWIYVAKTQPLLVASGVAGAVLTTLWLLRARGQWSDAEWKRLRWLIGCALLSLAPLLATFPANRLLLAPSIASAAVLASLLHALRGVPGWFSRAGRVVLWVTNVAIAIPPWAVAPWIMAHAADETERAFHETTLSDEALSRRVVLFVAPDWSATQFGSQLRTLGGHSAPRAWHVLSFALHDHTLKRVADSVFELEVEGGQWLESGFEGLSRADRFTLQPGDSVTLEDMKLTVVEVASGRPSKIRAELLRPLSELTFIQWREGRLVPLELPPVGEAVRLRHEPAVVERFYQALGS
jgi:hypothetical protein